MAEKRKILVVGAGIGGLAAAISLQRAGFETVVLERATEWKGLGAGIVLAANAMRTLDRLGVGDRVRERGAAVKSGVILAAQGGTLVDLPVEEQAKRYGTHAVVIHRAELQETLREQVRPGTIRLGAAVTRFEQDEHGVRVHLEDGGAVEGKVLVGADGIHSVVRTGLFGPSPLRYSGFTAVRGIAQFTHTTYPPGEGFEAWGAGKRFGFAHIGGGRIHWFAAINAPEGERDGPEGRKAETLRRFVGWQSPIPEVIAATEEDVILRHDIYDRAPLAHWSVGRVTLLGDAAHPMLPNLGQGAGQGIEDAAVLTNCLLAHEDVPAALQAYERLRIPRTAKIVKRSRAMSRMVQLEHPLLLQGRNLVLRLLPARMQMNRLNGVVGYEAWRDGVKR